MHAALMSCCNCRWLLSVLLLLLSLMLQWSPRLLAVQQVAFADRLLLNKTDLVSDAEKAAVIKRIRVGS